jgi:hypothetical protein
MPHRIEAHRQSQREAGQLSLASFWAGAGVAGQNRKNGQSPSHRRTQWIKTASKALLNRRKGKVKEVAGKVTGA